MLRQSSLFAANNDINSSILNRIGCSPNGWTDSELSLQWLEKVFIPHIVKTHGKDVPCILILDGHNSHTTYLFAQLATRHKIEIIVLPSHTTHRLQPCDVAVFSPLAAAYKKVVSDASLAGARISKRTLPSLYAKARVEAFKPSTIQTSFKKAGIWPLNRDAIEDEAYTPSKNTTCEAAMPIAVTLPNWLAKDSPLDPEAIPPTLRIPDLPNPSCRTSSKAEVKAENHQLRKLLLQAKLQIEGDFALKLLMEEENKRVRQELHGKKDNAPRKRPPGEGQARVLTACENLDSLAQYDWRKKMDAVLGDKCTKDALKIRRQIIKEDEEARVDAQKAAARLEETRRREVEKLTKQQQRENEKRQKSKERQRKAEEKRREKEEEKLRKAAQKASNLKAKNTRTTVGALVNAPKPRPKRALPTTSAQAKENKIAEDTPFTCPATIANNPDPKEPISVRRATRSSERQRQQQR